jgi:membrane protein YqaA with SNARE-associated domain
LSAWFRRLAERRWFLLALAVLTAADLFVVVFPVEGLTLAAVLANRKRWLRPAVAMAAGSTLGCWFLAEATYRHTAWVLDRMGSLATSAGWQWMQSQITDHGTVLSPLIVIAGAYAPLPVQVVTVVPALAGMRPELLFPALAVGRFGRSLLLCWAASRATGGLWRTMARFKKATRELKDLDPPK